MAERHSFDEIPGVIRSFAALRMTNAQKNRLSKQLQHERAQARSVRAGIEPVQVLVNAPRAPLAPAVALVLAAGGR